MLFSLSEVLAIKKDVVKLLKLEVLIQGQIVEQHMKGRWGNAKCVQS